MTVEKGIEGKERSELNDLKQQIDSLSTIMKSVVIGSVKSKGRGVSSLRKKELFGNPPQKGI